MGVGVGGGGWGWGWVVGGEGWVTIPLSHEEVITLVQQLDDGITMTSQESVVVSLTYSTT